MRYGLGIGVARRAVLGLVALSWAACTTIAPSGSAAPPRPGWPPGNPRLELDEVVGGEELRSRGPLRRLLGSSGRQVLRRPFGVGWDGGDLLVTDVDAARVVRLRGRRLVAASQPGVLESPIDVEVCGDVVAVSDSRRGAIVLLAEDLTFVRELAVGLERPTGLSCDGAGVLVAETGGHRIRRIAWGGERSSVWGSRGGGPGQLNFPSALALAAGRAWVGDTLNFRVQAVDLSRDSAAGELGRHGGMFGALGDAPGEMPRIKGLAVDSLGRLWISDALLSRVSLYSTDGTFLMDLGGEGAGPGEFSFPAGIAAHPDGRVAVVDSLNRRLQIFRPVDRPEGSDG